MQKVMICGIDTASLPKIGNKECIQLIHQIEEGSMLAREELIMSNLRLVLSVVKRFSGKGSSDDLFQVGVIGLIKAIDNFDTKFNVRFSTYAVPMIIGEIRRYIKDNSAVKVSRSTRDIAYKALHAKEIMEKNNSASPSIMEIAEEIDIPVNEVACALDAVSETRSLYESVYNDGEDNLMLMDQLSTNKKLEDEWSDTYLIRDCIKNLPRREKQVLTLRYYVGKTQTEISKALNVSQAQVSRLEKTALERIRSMIS